MVTKVAIPAKDLLPAIPDDAGPEHSLIKNSRETLNTLHTTLRSFTKDRSRVRNLVSFKDRAYKVKNADMEEDKVDRMSQVRHGDRPEIEMYLKHRDEAMALDEDIAVIRKKLDEIEFNENTAETLHKIVAKRDRLEEKRLRHMNAMTQMLEALSKEQDRGMVIMTKLTVDAAKIAQAATQHVDKMEIAREATSPTTDDLLAKMAAKYNIPVSEVAAMLAAKDAKPDDD